MSQAIIHKIAEFITNIITGGKPRSILGKIVYFVLFLFILFSIEIGLEYYKVTNVQFGVSDTSVSVCNTTPFLLIKSQDVHINKMILTLNYDDNKVATAEIKKEITINSAATKHFPILGFNTQKETYVANSHIINSLRIPPISSPIKSLGNLTTGLSVLKNLNVNGEQFLFTLSEHPSHMNYMKLKSTFTMYFLDAIPTISIDREFQTSKRYCT